MNQEIQVLKPKVAICGSMTVAEKMSRIASILDSQGFETLLPDAYEAYVKTNASQMDSVAKAVARKVGNNFIGKHIEKIQQADAVLIVNGHSRVDPNYKYGYVGGNTFGEIFAAYTLQLPIFYLESLRDDMSYSSELLAIPHKVGVNSVKNYFDSLPKALIASVSQLKIEGARIAFRNSGLPVRMFGVQTSSGVKEQPGSWSETEEGARQRLRIIH